MVDLTCGGRPAQHSVQTIGLLVAGLVGVAHAASQVGATTVDRTGHGTAVLIGVTTIGATEADCPSRCVLSNAHALFALIVNTACSSCRTAYLTVATTGPTQGRVIPALWRTGQIGGIAGRTATTAGLVLSAASDA